MLKLQMSEKMMDALADLVIAAASTVRASASIVQASAGAVNAVVGSNVSNVIKDKDLPSNVVNIKPS